MGWWVQNELVVLLELFKLRPEVPRPQENIMDELLDKNVKDNYELGLLLVHPSEGPISCPF